MAILFSQVSWIQNEDETNTSLCVLDPEERLEFPINAAQQKSNEGQKHELHI